MKSTCLLVLCIAVLMSSIASADHPAGFEIYDDFSDRTIDPDRWVGNQAFSHSGDEPEGDYTPWVSYDLQRMIKQDPESGGKKGKAEDGVLHLINTLQGVAADDVEEGMTRSRLGYSLREPTPIGVGGRFRYQDFEVFGSLDDCLGDSRSRLRIIMRLFNLFPEPPFPGSGDIGEIQAYVGLRRQEGFPEGKMRVEGRVFACGVPDCSITMPTWLIGEWSAPDHDGNFDFVHKGEDAVISMEWEKENHRVAFFYGTDEAVYFSFSDWITIGGESEGAAVQAALDLPACNSEPAFGYIDGFIDEVYVKYDD